MAAGQNSERLLREFIQRHAFNIPGDQWAFVQEGQQHEIEDGLYQEEYMPSIIRVDGE